MEGGTGGFYMCQGKTLLASEGHADHIFRTPARVSSVAIHALNDNVGDSIDIVVDPETVIGILSDEAEQGSTVLHVSRDIPRHVVPGFFVVIDNQEVGQIVEGRPRKVAHRHRPTHAVLCIRRYAGLRQHLHRT